MANRVHIFGLTILLDVDLRQFPILDPDLSDNFTTDLDYVTFKGLNNKILVHFRKIFKKQRALNSNLSILEIIHHCQHQYRLLFSGSVMSLKASIKSYKTHLDEWKSIISN